MNSPEAFDAFQNSPQKNEAGDAFAFASLLNSKAAYRQLKLGALAAPMSRACRYGRAVRWCRNHGGGQRCVRTDQTYHQEQHPDCFHWVVLLVRVSWERRPSLGTDYTGSCQVFRQNCSNGNDLTSLLRAWRGHPPLFLLFIFQSDRSCLLKRFRQASSSQIASQAV